MIANHALATLAKTPRDGILKIMTGLSLLKADPLLTRTTDEIMNSIHLAAEASCRRGALQGH